MILCVSDILNNKLIAPITAIYGLLSYTLPIPYMTLSAAFTDWLVRGMELARICMDVVAAVA